MSPYPLRKCFAVVAVQVGLSGVGGDGKAGAAYLAGINLLAAEGVFVGTHDGGSWVIYLFVEVVMVVGLSVASELVRVIQDLASADHGGHVTAASEISPESHENCSIMNTSSRISWGRWLQFMKITYTCWYNVVMAKVLTRMHHRNVVSSSRS